MYIYNKSIHLLLLQILQYLQMHTNKFYSITSNMSLSWVLLIAYFFAPYSCFVLYYFLKIKDIIHVSHSSWPYSVQLSRFLYIHWVLHQSGKPILKYFITHLKKTNTQPEAIVWISSSPLSCDSPFCWPQATPICMCIEYSWLYGLILIYFFSTN